MRRRPTGAARDSREDSERAMYIILGLTRFARVFLLLIFYVFIYATYFLRLNSVSLVCCLLLQVCYSVLVDEGMWPVREGL